MTAADGGEDHDGLVDYSDPAARGPLEALGEAVWRLALDYVYDQAMVRPVGPDSPSELRRRFFGASSRPATAPGDGADLSEVLTEVRDRVLPYAYNAHHPRSFSYFSTPPLPASVAGDVLAAWLHQSVDVFHASPIGALVEEEVTTWLCDLVGTGTTGWGVLTSGGVMANLMALTVMRDVHLARRLASDRPPRGSDLAKARIYCSDQAHFSIQRGLDILGFPADVLRVVPSDGYRLPPAAVRAAIQADAAAGLVPLGICAVAGTTNTGSIDPIPALADIAQAAGVWLHVDAAYGGAVLASDRDRRRIPGLDLADSVTVDPHKWFFQAFDIGGLIVNRRGDLHRTFVRRPEYYRSSLADEDPLAWMEYSLEGTRRFRALKLWLTWKQLGTNGFGRLVERTNDLAAHLADLVRKAPDFELAVDPPELSVVCFRHLPADDLSAEALDRHQDRVQRRLEASGRAWVSTTRLQESTWLRAGVMNHMTTRADLAELLAALRDCGAREQS